MSIYNPTLSPYECAELALQHMQEKFGTGGYGRRCFFLSTKATMNDTYANLDTMRLTDVLDILRIDQ